jgi:hypothetical protein
MPWRGSEYPGEFPTLGYQVAELIQQKCVIPDGDRAGDPFVLTDEMLRFLLWHYRIDPEHDRFFFNRGAQLVRPQKWGKGPFSAALIVAECDPDAPVRFDGWDSSGEPVGRPWATPWVQVTAVSEDQAANVYRALVPMIELGGLAAEIPDTGQTRINLPGGGRIEPVTASARSRLGQRITFAVQDETHSWGARNGGHQLAYNQRRNLAGMGGRFVSTTNAWDPTEDSVAQRDGESRAPGMYRDDVEPGGGSVRNKAERRRMMRRVYGDSWWVDLDRVDSEVVALIEDGEAAQAERFFLNRKQAGESAAFDPDRWAELADTAHVVPSGALIVLGVDGARHNDAVAVVATEVETGFQWPVKVIEAPKNPGPDYEHSKHELDGAVSEAFDRYSVWRAYCDPQYIEYVVEGWQGRFGEKRVVNWYTNAPRKTAEAVRNFTAAIGAGDVSHDGDPVFSEHVRNARKRRENIRDENQRPLHTLAKDSRTSPRKIDAAMAAVLSWECRGDAIAAGATAAGPSRVLVAH